MEIQSSASIPTTTRAEVAKKGELGKDDFLRLLTTQLANQDPLKPVDNQAFVAQLAQFASVEQLHTVSSSLESLLLAQASSNQLQVAGLVGKQVLFQADGVDLATGGTAKLSTRLAERAAVTVVVQDSAGRTVRTLPLGDRDPGALEIEWDGRLESGDAAPAGHYRVVATASVPDGTTTPLELRSVGTVQGAAFGEAGPMLLVGGARVKLSDVLEIHQG